MRHQVPTITCIDQVLRWTAHVQITPNSLNHVQTHWREKRRYQDEINRNIQGRSLSCRFHSVRIRSARGLIPGAFAELHGGLAQLRIFQRDVPQAVVDRGLEGQTRLNAIEERARRNRSEFRGGQ